MCFSWTLNTFSTQSFNIRRGNHEERKYVTWIDADKLLTFRLKSELLDIKRTHLK